MKLIVGLGNPGEKYAQTRHNIGWLVIDELARRAGANWRGSAPQNAPAHCAEIRLGEPSGGASPQPLQPLQKVLLLKPQTFMNASGLAVRPLMDYYRLADDDLLVIQDDLDSPFGLLKLRRGGRHGGQNGVRDIIELLGSQDFARLKLGISRPPQGRSPADWVLSKWAAEEQEILAELVNLGASAAAMWATEGLLAAQAHYNSTDLRPKPPVQAVASTTNSPISTANLELSQPD